MRTCSLLEVVGTFDAAGVRALIVGGYAVIAHGVIRATVDLDLVLDLSAPGLRAALEELARRGFRPRAPVPLADFADPTLRASWVHDKDMQAFTMWRHEQPHLPDEVDLFISEPFPFAQAWAESLAQNTPAGLRLHFVDRRRLAAMKRLAGRPKDLLDLTELERVHGDLG